MSEKTNEAPEVVKDEGAATDVKLNVRETELIKATFTGNESLLKIIRKFLLGIATSAAEKDAIRGVFANDELFQGVRRKFLPALDDDTDIGQNSEPWAHAEKMILGMPPDTIKQALAYKHGAIKMTQNAMDGLRDPHGVTMPSMMYDPDMTGEDELGIRLLTRNMYIRNVEDQLVFLWIIAEQENATPEEMAKRLKLDETQ